MYILYICVKIISTPGSNAAGDDLLDLMDQAIAS